MTFKYSSYNLDNFGNHDSNKVFVIGLCGSGKSTISEHLSIIMKAELRTTDSISLELSPIKHSDRSKYEQLYLEQLNNLIDSNSRLLIEGMGNLKLPWGFLCSQPLIIVKTSLIRCSHNCAIRSGYRFLSPSYFARFFEILKHNIPKWLEIRKIEQYAKSYYMYSEYYAE